MSDVIRLTLTDEQSAKLAPTVLEAARQHENIIFAVIVPYRSGEEITWELQATYAPATLGARIKKLILAGGKN